VTEPKRYVSNPVEIIAVELAQYGDFVRVTKWINENGGSAVFNPKLVGDQEDYLIITTLEGNMEAHMGWWVIQGTEGEFYACKPSVFERKYHLAEPEEDYTPQPGSGTYQPGSTETSGERLKGGAALPLP
jgi:hypothetical protein